MDSGGVGGLASRVQGGVTIGLNQLALDHYSQALALAQTQADLPGQAQAQWDRA
ncbi:hypothetical protein [Prochlorothrix hollandica]|uniref:hypothetical protein n=1 Tax=Prochlorothrix hollandica TaxID=1223 RepID=UPI0033429F25